MEDLNNIVVVSDGGMDRKCCSFGWILGTHNSERLAQGSGLVFGYDPTSYRSEISGSRAGLLFICHAHVYCERKMSDGCLTVYCDNTGYVTKLTSMMDYPLASVASCLDAEWDLLISAHQLFSLFPTQPKLCHIKGHQDREILYEVLDPIAQMKVDADRLATIELREFGTEHVSVPLNPFCKVVLHIEQRTITREIERSVQEELFLRKLRIYTCDRFGWTESTFESVDWDMYSQVYSHYPRFRKFFY